MVFIGRELVEDAGDGQGVADDAQVCAVGVDPPQEVLGLFNALAQPAQCLVPIRLLPLANTATPGTVTGSK